MRTFFEIMRDPKPMRLTMTYEASGPAAMFVSLIAREAGLTEDAVAQRIFNYLTGAFSGRMAVTTFEPTPMLTAIFPELDNNGPLLTIMRRYVPDAGKGDVSGFDFRKFLGAML